MSRASDRGSCVLRIAYRALRLRIEHMFDRPLAPHGPLRRTPLPQQLLVPRRCLPSRRPGGAGRRTGVRGAGGHRPRRLLRGGPLPGGGRRSRACRRCTGWRSGVPRLRGERRAGRVTPVADSRRAARDRDRLRRPGGGGSGGCTAPSRPPCLPPTTWCCWPPTPPGTRCCSASGHPGPVPGREGPPGLRPRRTGRGRRPRAGLVALTGCHHGAVPRAAQPGDLEGAMAAAVAVAGGLPGAPLRRTVGPPHAGGRSPQRGAGRGGRPAAAADGGHQQRPLPRPLRGRPRRGAGRHRGAARSRCRARASGRPPTSGT